MKCLFCNKQFYPKGKQNCGCGMKFCSPDCRLSFWSKNNPERLKEIACKSRLKCKKQRIEYGHHYYILNKKKMQRYSLSWRRKHPSLVVQQVINRRYKIKGNGGNHTLRDWQELKRKCKYRCVVCGKRKPLTRDHIFPISKGGINDISNIQPLCRACNSRKFNHI